MCLLAVVVGLGALAAAGLWRASRAGKQGQAQLALAEHDLLAQRVEPTRQDVRAAIQDFVRMRDHLHSFPFGTALAFWRVVPFVRVQVRAVDTFAAIGVSLSEAGQQITDAAAIIDRPSGPAVPLSASLDKLRTAQVSLHHGVAVLDDATAQVSSLNRYRLLGPLAGAHRDASRRLKRIDVTAHSADQAVSALVAFTGGAGPRRYLILSQNPDEVRPTGGFLGSYGILTADGGRVTLERYDDSITWVADHPQATIPGDQLGSPFRFYDPPLEQTLANTNATPDWPASAQQALTLWQKGGEMAADGVVSFTPQFLARVLAVTGPVSVPSFNETVNSGNALAKVDFYTHVVDPKPGQNRKKEFLSPLGQAVMAKLLDAPPAQWRGLGVAVGQAFSARELLVWSRDGTIQSTLTQRGWDGAFPSAEGNFFFDSEFEYGAKNGRGLKRMFDNHVTLQADGSAQVTTTIRIANTEGPGEANNKVLTYYTLYGPDDAVVDAAASDPPFSPEPALAGHPAAGWFRTVIANSTGTIKVVWSVPALAQRLSDGSWQLPIRWMHIVDNTGDTLRVTVDLPPQAHWVGPAPQTQWTLDHDITAVWRYRISG